MSPLMSRKPKWDLHRPISSSTPCKYVEWVGLNWNHKALTLITSHGRYMEFKDGMEVSSPLLKTKVQVPSNMYSLLQDCRSATWASQKKRICVWVVVCHPELTGTNLTSLLPVWKASALLNDQLYTLQTWERNTSVRVSVRETRVLARFCI